MNHLALDVKVTKKLKCLENDSNGVYWRKIFVKDIAQKTDAYQLIKLYSR